MKRMSPEEAASAVYVDFEGYEESTPALIGCLVEGHFAQVVTDPALYVAGGAKRLETTEFISAWSVIEDRARMEDRKIVAYSTHEMKIVLEYCDTDIFDIFVNARTVIKSWWNRTGARPRPTDWGQKAVERALGLKRPRHLAGGNATRRLRFVSDQIATRGSFDALTPTAKAKWTKLLRYNELDVRHMLSIVETAAGSRTVQ